MASRSATRIPLWVKIAAPIAAAALIVTTWLAVYPRSENARACADFAEAYNTFASAVSLKLGSELVAATRDELTTAAESAYEEAHGTVRSSLADMVALSDGFAAGDQKATASFLLSAQDLSRFCAEDGVGVNLKTISQSAATPATRAERRIMKAAPTTRVTFAVAGDSITAWLNYSYPNWNGYNDPHSWARYAVDAQTVMLGGYARSGAGVQHVAADIHATGADVLVIHLGTNDYNMAWATMMPYLDQIVAEEASPHVVVVGIPPLITKPGFVVPDNVALAAWASLHGYRFVNPYLGLVTVDGTTWLPGFSADGIHPLPSTAALTGPIIRAAIREAVAEPPRV